MPMPSSNQAADIIHTDVDAPSKREPRRKNDVRNAEHLPSTDAVDLTSDARTKQSGDHQRRRERREEPVARNPEIARDRIGQDRRQIVARAPRQRLGGTKRRDDAEP